MGVEDYRGEFDRVNNASYPSVEREDQITLLDLFIVFAKHKVLVIGLPLVAAVASASVSLLLPNVYVAAAKILPPQPQQSSAAAAMLGQLGALTGAAGALGIKNPSELYVGMLKSRTVADNLIQRFDLNKRYEQKYQTLTRNVLEGNSAINAGKDGIITVEVEDKDPKFAADVANAYVDELYKLTQVLAVTEASQRRLFFERQFAQSKENLEKAETTARQALQQGGLVKVDDQGRAIVETTARLRAQIAAKEVQIGAMRTFASEGNPELRFAQQEAESLKRELARLEGSAGFRAVAGASGGKGLDNLRLLRDLRYNEVLYELLAKQYEIAKIDEAKDSAIIQVLDKAIPPDRKAKPKRSLIVLAWTLAALLLTVIWIFVTEAIAKAKQNPEGAARLQALKHYLSWR